MRKQSVNRGLVRTNISQLFLSKDFIIAIIMNVFIMLLSIIGGQGIEEAKNYGVCHTTFYMLYFGMLPKLIVLVSCLPVIATFCTRWNTGYIRFEVERAGEKRYLKHTVYKCMAGTFLTAFLSLILFTLILCIIMPVNTELGLENLKTIYPFGSLVESNPVLYQLIRITCFSTFCSVWSMLGLAISAFIPNRYVVYSASFVSYYVIEQIFNNKISENAPTIFLIPYLGNTALTMPLFNNGIVDYIYINSLFIGLSLLIGKGFIYGARRRLRNE